MKTYVINLEDAVARKQYMQEQLEKLPLLSPEFIAAVDGRKMTEQEQKQVFDIKKFEERYSRKVRSGEIGCTLSHQKCYQKLVDSVEEYALILEDDAVLNDYYQNCIVNDICPLLQVDIPQIVLLSGRYWYFKSQRLSENYRIAEVYDALQTHAYVINRSAAKLLIEAYPFIYADDWWYIRNKGIRIRAILPHLVDQIVSEQYPTQISEGGEQYLKRITWKRMKRHFHFKILKFLSSIGRYETCK